MYVDKVAGRIDNDFFDRKAADFWAEQVRIMDDIAAPRTPTTHIEEGVRLLALARRAAVMFADQPPAEKRELLDCVVSSRQWKNGELEPVYRDPFATMVEAGARKPVQGMC
jgi:hypothetical protein